MPESAPSPAPAPKRNGGQAVVPRTPRWVKVCAAIAVLGVVIIVVLLVTGGPGRHGPARHIGGESPGQRPEPAAEHTPPPGLPSHSDQQR